MSPLTLFFSSFEYIWGAFSAWVAYTLWAVSSAPVWLPVIFVTYLIIMVGWGFSEYKDHDPDRGMPSLTPGMVYAGISFGGLFLLCSIYVLLSQ